MDDHLFLWIASMCIINNAQHNVPQCICFVIFNSAWTSLVVSHLHIIFNLRWETGPYSLPQVGHKCSNQCFYATCVILVTSNQNVFVPCCALMFEIFCLFNVLNIFLNNLKIGKRGNNSSAAKMSSSVLCICMSTSVYVVSLKFRWHDSKNMFL